MLYFHIEGLIKNKKEDDNNNRIFKKISNSKLKTYFNTLFNNVFEETSKIYLYMEEKVKQFPELFGNDLKNIEDTIKYLEKIAIPNNCDCASIIDVIPCWRCLDCTDFDCIYCSNCFIKSKDLHKGHKIHFLPKVEGMCDCGDPNSFKIFCPEHKGPLNEQKQIDEFIEKSFSPDVLKKLYLFFDDYFYQFSKYLILTENCNYFCEEIFLKNIHNPREKDDVNMLKDNFCIVFQNFLTFIYIITNKNMGMLYIITKYILKNHFQSENLDVKFKTDHTCIKLENKNIKILYENKDKNNNLFSLNDENSKDNHICKCSFLRLLLSNWRDKIKTTEENQNEKLLLSFAHNIYLKEEYTLLYFFIFKEIILNKNEDIISERNQFFSENNFLLISNQTNIFENAYNIFYIYSKEVLNNKIVKDKNEGFDPILMKKMLDLFLYINNDLDYFTKSKAKEIFDIKINLTKLFIDIACLIHNQCEYESIYPHPEFQAKNFVYELIKCELLLIKIAFKIIFCYNIENINKIQDIFDYLINKILNQDLGGIKKLKQNEFSFHLTLYRFFGIFLNYFILNYSLDNNKNIFDAIEYIKTKLFKSKEEMQKVIDLIIDDYFKMFGFILGIRNGYFNYYDSLENYNEIYFNELQFIKYDFTLLKYLLAMSDKKINIDNILKVSNIENIYSFFNRIFKEDNSNNDKSKNEDEKKHIIQWIRLLEIIITIMKNDSTHYSNLLSFYNDIISSKAKNDLFNKIKNNNKVIIDLKNNLKQILILIFIGNGNYIDLETIKKYINDYYFKIFTEKEFSEILKNLADNKIDNKKIIYILKDSSLKYLDIDFFFSPITKSKAELYLCDFKKDKFKLFNSYYFKPSILSFDFYNKIFENILLNNENIELIIKIIEILLPKESNDNFTKNINPIKDEFLPIILKFITMIGEINSINFIKFKLDNKNLFNKIFNILNNAIQNNKNNSLLDKDLSENVMNTMNHINKYQVIYDNINQNLNDLNEYDYNNDNNDILSLKNTNSLNDNNNNDFNTKKKKANKMKEKYKNLIKQKRNNFIEKIQKDKRMTNIIEAEDSKNIEEEKDNIMCFLCRNYINLNSFEKPYGKIGDIYKDFFYKNSFRSSIKKELNKINEKESEEKNKIYLNIKENNKEDISIRIISCGHYFHQSCFKEKLNEFRDIKCPVCEKTGNILIPPLTNFYSKIQYLLPEKLDNILDKTKEIQKKEEEINKDIDIFKEINISFLQSIIKTKLNPKKEVKDCKNIINELLLNFEHSLNYLYSLFFCEANTFYKQEQIDNIQNIVLAIRYLIKIDYIKINQVINYMRDEIDNIKKGPNEKDNVIENYRKMNYMKSIDKILFLFIILLDYDDFKKLYAYIINWTLTYFIFWIYLRNIFVENNFYSLYDEKLKEKINFANFNQFLNDNNKTINIYLKLFLQKLLLIKKIINFDGNNNKEDLFKNINNLTMENIFQELNIENLYQILSKDVNNDIKSSDIFEKVKEFIILDKSLLNKDCIILDSNLIINALINNIIKTKEEKYLVNAEFIYQFILYKFELIELEYNIFDFIEKNLFQKCHMCNKLKKKNFLCLICGNKICQDEIISHSLKCTFADIIYINLQSMTILCFYDFQNFKVMHSLYTNEFNAGPNSNFISNEYNLNKENYKLALKNFICLNFNN